MNRQTGLTIGQVAKRANVNVQTLHYYERRGILRPLTRRESGYRVYDEEAVRTVQFIKWAQKLGFTLEDIQELLSLRFDRKSKCADVQTRAKKTLEEIEKKISHLKGMERSLKKLIRDCDNRKMSGEGGCPVLDGFDHGERA